MIVRQQLLGGRTGNIMLSLRAAAWQYSHWLPVVSLDLLQKCRSTSDRPHEIRAAANPPRRRLPSLLRRLQGYLPCHARSPRARRGREGEARTPRQAPAARPAASGAVVLARVPHPVPHRGRLRAARVHRLAHRHPRRGCADRLGPVRAEPARDAARGGPQDRGRGARRDGEPDRAAEKKTGNGATTAARRSATRTRPSSSSSSARV